MLHRSRGLGLACLPFEVGDELGTLVHELFARPSAVLRSQYATTVSGSTPGFTLPQLTASAGVAPESPPQTTWSVVIWMK